MALWPSLSRRLPATALAVLLLGTTLTGCGGGEKSAPDPAPETPVTAAPSSPDPAPVTPPVTDPVAPPIKTEPPVKPVPELPGAIGVMIDNHPNARPHYGLDKADLVYEMEAEGGISRFLAFFYLHGVEKIGPVRSARMGFYDVATAYGTPYAHAGGNNDVLIELKNNNRALLNLDDIYGGGGSFWRDDAREMPHNLFTNTERITTYAQAIGFELKPLPEPNLGPAPEGGKEASRIAFSWGPRSQDVVWAYNGERYMRSQSGSPHVTADGTQIQADNLILLFTRFVWDQSAQWGEGQNNISIVGSGSGYLFRNGKVFPIHWEKPSRDAHYRFTLADGTAAPLVSGQTWIEILKEEGHVTEGL